MANNILNSELIIKQLDDIKKSLEHEFNENISIDFNMRSDMLKNDKQVAKNKSQTDDKINSFSDSPELDPEPEKEQSEHEPSELGFKSADLYLTPGTKPQIDSNKVKSESVMHVIPLDLTSITNIAITESSKNSKMKKYKFTKNDHI